MEPLENLDLRLFHDQDEDHGEDEDLVTQSLSSMPSSLASKLFPQMTYCEPSYTKVDIMDDLLYKIHTTNEKFDVVISFIPKRGLR
jgi:hypothetical protein